MNNLNNCTTGIALWWKMQIHNESNMSSTKYSHTTTMKTINNTANFLFHHTYPQKIVYLDKIFNCITDFPTTKCLWRVSMISLNMHIEGDTITWPSTLKAINIIKHGILATGMVSKIQYTGVTINMFDKKVSTILSIIKNFPQSSLTCMREIIKNILRNYIHW